MQYRNRNRNIAICDWTPAMAVAGSTLLKNRNMQYRNRNIAICDWTPAMAVAGSTLLKNRNMHMNATASLISLMVRQSATQV